MSFEPASGSAGVDGPASSASSTQGEPGVGLDPGAEERCATVVGWHLDPLLATASEVRPELRSMIGRIAATRCVGLMDRADAELLLKQLARRVVETRS